MSKQLVAQSGINVARNQTPTISERKPEVIVQKPKIEV